MTDTERSGCDERLRERERWMEFERRDGWCSGFICGVLVVGVALVVLVLIPLALDGRL